MLNHTLILSQKLKLIGRDEFDHLFYILAFLYVWDQNSPLISKAQRVKYLIEMGCE